MLSLLPFRRRVNHILRKQTLTALPPFSYLYLSAPLLHHRGVSFHSYLSPRLTVHPTFRFIHLHFVPPFFFFFCCFLLLRRSAVLTLCDPRVPWSASLVFSAASFPFDNCSLFCSYFLQFLSLFDNGPQSLKDTYKMQ